MPKNVEVKSKQHNIVIKEIIENIDSCKLGVLHGPKKDTLVLANEGNTVHSFSNIADARFMNSNIAYVDQYGDEVDIAFVKPQTCIVSEEREGTVFSCSPSFAERLAKNPSWSKHTYKLYLQGLKRKP